MPLALYDPVDRLIDFEDRFTEFARSTLQGEQDFHVGLRSDLDQEYRKFGVQSAFFVSTPSPTANMDQENSNSTFITQSFDNAPQAASIIVKSVLTNVNNKIKSGEVSLVEVSNESVESVRSMESIKSLDSRSSNRSKQQSYGGNNNIPLSEPISSQSTTGIIPEIESAIKDISERIDRILSPSKDENTTDLLDEIKSAISLEVGKVQGIKSRLSIVEEPELQQKYIASSRSKRSITSLCDSAGVFKFNSSSRSSLPSNGAHDRHFNYEEIIRKKTGRAPSVHSGLDVEAENELELDTENMPMEISISPDMHIFTAMSNPKVDSQIGTPSTAVMLGANGSVTHQLGCDDQASSIPAGRRRSFFVEDAEDDTPVLTAEQKAAEKLKEDVASLQKEVAWLEEEVRALRETVSERNVKLAESQQLRRNLEEELNLIQRKNSGLERATAAAIRQFHNYKETEDEEGQLAVTDGEHHDLNHRRTSTDDSAVKVRNKKSRFCVIL